MRTLCSWPKDPDLLLSQLYSQATLASASLFPYVLQLGIRYNGLFQLKERTSHRSSQKIVFRPILNPHDREHLQLFQFGGVKGVQQCMDKIDNIYGGSVSRLLDICREKIVFERVSDLASCLEQLVNDPSITVMRIKSSMGASANKKSAMKGFKQVVLNIKIDNEQTRRLCVHHHVCEILLQVKDMARLLDDESIMRYRFVKNVSGFFMLSKPLRNFFSSIARLKGAFYWMIAGRRISSDLLQGYDPQP